MYKQVIVIRGDLNISCGKAVAQGAHASVSLVLKIIESDEKTWKKWLDSWLSHGQKKIVLRARSEEELLQVYSKAREMRLPAYLVVDAGHTEVPPGTKTAIAIGPAPEKEIDKITGMLPLYR